MLNNIKAMNYPDAPTLSHGVGTVSSVVNLASGTMTLEHRDMTLGEGAFGLSVGHIYRKDWAGDYASQVSSGASRNWKLNLEQYVLPAAKNETEPDGLPVKYVYIDPLGSRHNILEYAAGTVKTYSDASGLGLVMTLSGNKKVLTDALGNTLTFDAAGRLETVIKRTGYDSTTLYHTETTSYTYTDNRLTAVTNRRHRVDIRYGADGKISSIVGDNGKPVILPSYNADGEVISISQRVDGETENIAAFSYEGAARLAYAYPKSSTFLRFAYAEDAAPQSGVRTHSVASIAECANDAAGAICVKRSDTIAYESALTTSVTDDMGVTLCYYYDKRGNTASILERYTDAGVAKYSSIAPVKGNDGGLRITKTDQTSSSQINGGNIITAAVGTNISIRDEGALKEYTGTPKLIDFESSSVVFSAWVNAEGYTGDKLELQLSRANPTIAGGVTNERGDLKIAPGRTGWRYYQAVISLRNRTMKTVGLKLSGDAGSVKIADVRLAKLPLPQAVLEDTSGNRAALNAITKLTYTQNGMLREIPLGGDHTVTQQDVEATMRDKCVSYKERGSSAYRLSYDNGKRIVPGVKDVIYYAGARAYTVRDNTETSQFFYVRTSDVVGKRLDKDYISYENDPYYVYCARHIRHAAMGSVKSSQSRYYNLLGRETLMRDEYNVDKIYSYDQYGNLLSSKIYAKSGTASKVILYNNTYSSTGEYRTSSADARFPDKDGVKTYYDYDEQFGVLSGVRDTDSAQRMEYDPFRKRMTKTEHKDASGKLLAENRLYYDAKDRLTSAISGTELAFGYDIFGNLATVDSVERPDSLHAGSTSCGSGCVASGVPKTNRFSAYTETKSGSQIIAEAGFGGVTEKKITIMDRYRRPLRVVNGASVYDFPALINTLSDMRGGTVATSAAKLRSSVDRSAEYDYKYVYDENDMLSRYEVRDRLTGKLIHTVSADNNYEPNPNEKAYRYTASGDFYNPHREQQYILIYDPNVLIEPRLIGMTNKQFYRDEGTIEITYKHDELGRITEERRRILPTFTDVVNMKTIYEYLDVKTMGQQTTTTPYVSRVTNLSNSRYTDSDYTENDRSDYSYDNDGRIVNVLSSGGNRAKYAYDALGRVTRFDGERIGGKAYSFDHCGNISEVSNYEYAGSAVLSKNSFVYNGDRLLKADNGYYKYNAAGYPTHYGVSSSGLSGTANMTWNSGNLKRFNNISYKYDAFGRMIEEVGADGITKRFYYDGTKLLREEWSDKSSYTYIYDASGIIGYHYLSATGGYKLVHFDKYPDGSIKNVVWQGLLVETYSYDPYGNCSAKTYTKPSGSPFNISNPIRWKGRRYDESSGFYLLEGGWYDPSVMRMVTPRNGAELFASAGAAYGLNRYILNGNRPMEIGESGATLFPSMEMIPIPPGASWWDKNGWWMMLLIGVGCIFLSGAVAGIGAIASASGLACAVKTAGMAMGTAFTMAVTGMVSGFVTGMVMGALFTAIGGGGIEDVLDAAINGALDGAAIGFMTGAIMGLFSAFQGMSSPAYCFIAGTLVKTRDGDKKIEEVEVDDEVLSYDEKTGQSEWKKVVKLFRNTTESWCTVRVKPEGESNHGKDERVSKLCAITSTPGHKYYVPENREIREVGEKNEHASYEGLSVQWVSAANLRPGDKVLLSNGKYGIVQDVKIKKLDKPETTYNLEVEDNHTYYVGTSGVCVHNTNCDGKQYYDSIKDHPAYPKDFQRVQNGKINNTINNKQLLRELQHDYPGKWTKVYDNGYVNGQKISLHYNQHKITGKIFDFEPHWGKWS